MVRSRADVVQQFNKHPLRSFILFVSFGVVCLLFGLLRLIFLFRNYPSERSATVIVAVISATIVVPAVLGIFNNSPFRRLCVAIFVVAVVPSIPILYSSTRDVGFYASRHWLEVPFDFVSIVFGGLVIVKLVQRKAWISLS